MASIFRLGSRQFLNQVLRNEKSGMLAFVRPVTLKAQPAQPPSKLGHDERNMKLNRPQSPHLTIYAPEITSMLSISHRFTGLALTGYAIILGVGTLVLPDTIPHYIDILPDYLGPASLFALKFLIAFPTTYHFWNGIRHLSWDLGKNLSLKEIYTTGYIMLTLAIGSAIALCAM